MHSKVMSAFDAVAYAIGEATAYIAGSIVGRTFSLERKRAQGIGEYMALGALVITLATITFVYS